MSSSPERHAEQPQAQAQAQAEAQQPQPQQPQAQQAQQPQAQAPQGQAPQGQAPQGQAPQGQAPQAQQQQERRWERPSWYRTRQEGTVQPSTARLPGETVLRGAEAETVAAADFTVNLRARPAHDDRQLAEAHAVGFAAGWAQGRLEAAEAEQAAALQAAAERARIQAEQEARFEQALGAVAVAAAQLQQRALPNLVAAEQLLVQGAIEIAEAILGAELRNLPEPGRLALTRVLSDLPQDDPVTVRISPADLGALDPEGSGSGTYEFDGRPVTLIPDPALQTGDAIAECGPVTVDGRLRAALERVKEELGAC